jgi:hypothetical protein
VVHEGVREVVEREGVKAMALEQSHGREPLYSAAVGVEEQCQRDSGGQSNNG